MAGTIRFFSRINLNLLTSNVRRQFLFNGARTVYTQESLGMNDFRRVKETFTIKYRMGIDAFRTKMENVVESEKEMVFTEDLKAIIHLTEKSPAEIELLKKCLLKYNSQSSDLRFSSFKFGPVVMRAFHYLNEVDLAYEFFMDPKFDQFFNQHTSYIILLDLLHENGKYQQVCDAYQKILTTLGTITNHPRMLAMIVALSCYKLNTPESLEYLLKIWKEIVDRGNLPVRKFIAIVSALALKQNRPHVALELVASCKYFDYISIRSIRIMALADMEKVEDIVLSFQNSLKEGQMYKTQYYKDTFEKVEAMINRLGNENTGELRDLLQTLKHTSHIFDTTLDEHIQLPIDETNRRKRSKHYEDQKWGDAETNILQPRTAFI